MSALIRASWLLLAARNVWPVSTGGSETANDGIVRESRLCPYVRKAACQNSAKAAEGHALQHLADFELLNSVSGQAVITVQVMAIKN